MSKKNDDSLERFFRKAVNQQDDTFLEKDWQSMEKLLDERAIESAAGNAGSFTRKAIILSGVAAIILSVYFFMPKSDHPGVGDDPAKEQQVAAVVEAPVQHDDKTIPSVDLLSSQNTPLPEYQAVKLPPRKSSLVGQHPREEEKFIVQSRDPEAITPETNIDNPILTGSETGPGEKPQSAEVIHQEESDNIEPENPLPAATESEALKKEDQDQQFTNSSRWNLALVIAPDFSTTSLGRYSAPGKTIGVLVGFTPLKRFSVNTGVLINKKKYEGYGDEYEPPEGYWQRRTNGVVPDEVNGHCTIVEVPLIIQYDIVQHLKNRVFVGGGASSYFMTDEGYEYYFDQPNPGASESWSSREGSSYPFGVGYFSAGYERRFGRSFAMGIEPFIKVPFASIGWSNIDLFTVGANINFRYRLSMRESL